MKAISIDEAKAQNLVQLYTFSSASEVLRTQYGKLRVDEWLAREQARIASDPRRSAAVVADGGLLALFVNDVRGVREHDVE